MTLLIVTSSFAQEKESGSKVGSVIEMDDLMFRYRIIDYKSGETEWKYKGDKPCIIDFYATWCAPCRMIAPSLKELAMAMGIQSMPTILLIPMTGNPQIIVGAADKNTFRRAIEEVLLP